MTSSPHNRGQDSILPLAGCQVVLPIQLTQGKRLGIDGVGVHQFEARLLLTMQARESVRQYPPGYSLGGVGVTQEDARVTRVLNNVLLLKIFEKVTSFDLSWYKVDFCMNRSLILSILSNELLRI